MTRFLTTTATALVLGTAAFAETNAPTFKDLTFDQSVNLHASELIGMRIYASEAEIHNTAVAADGEKEWDDIGEVNDIILTRDGSVDSIIVGVGGFIGIGEKDVAIDMSQLKFVSDGEAADEFFLVVNASVAGVEEAPAYERGIIGKETNDTASGRPLLSAPTIEREGYASVDPKDLTTEDLTGARVYGVNDEDVGEISELIVTDNGKLDRAVIDVGGFLGLGEHPVAVTLDELEIVRNGDSVRVYIDSSQEMLEKQPEYQG